MSVPGFQDLMRPVLVALEDDEPRRLSRLAELVGKTLKLTSEEMSEMLPKARQRRFYNRIAWAAIYLSRAGLLSRSGRGIYRITERGRGAIREFPRGLDIQALNKFDGFRAWREQEGKEADEPAAANAATLTPEERIVGAHGELQSALEAELLDQLKNVSPTRFEDIVLVLLQAMGYGDSVDGGALRIGKAGDGELDGVIKQDQLGLEEIYVQAKRWDGSVTPKEVRSFAGGLEAAKATKGVFLTTGVFTKDCKEFVGKIAKRIILIDGSALVKQMVRHGVGVVTERAFEIKRANAAFFADSEE